MSTSKCGEMPLSALDAPVRFRTELYGPLELNIDILELNIYSAGVCLFLND